MASPKELLDRLNSGKHKSAYYFYGPEGYRISEAQKFVARKFLPDKQLAINYRKIDGKKTKAGDLMAELSNLPMLGERQVFAVSDFQRYKPTERASIYKLIVPNDPSRIVIFTSPPARAPKKSSAFVKEISKVAEAVEFQKLTEVQVMAQVRGKFEKAGVKIEPEAVRILAHLIAGNRGALEGEVAKLVSFKGEDATISVEDVKKVSSGYEVFNMFHLAEQVVAGNSRKVLQMIKGLFAGGIGPTVLASLLQQHYMSLYLVKNGKNPLGNRGWLVPEFRRQAANYENKQLESAIIKIAQLDSDLRRTGMKKETALEVLVISLIGESKNAT